MQKSCAINEYKYYVMEYACSNGTEIRCSNLSPICSWLLLPVKAMTLTQMEYALISKASVKIGTKSAAAATPTALLGTSLQWLTFLAGTLYERSAVWSNGHVHAADTLDLWYCMSVDTCCLRTESTNHDYCFLCTGSLQGSEAMEYMKPKPS